MLRSAVNMYTKDSLCGKEKAPGAPGSTCDESRIANPDNVNIIEVCMQLGLQGEQFCDVDVAAAAR